MFNDYNLIPLAKLLDLYYYYPLGFQAKVRGKILPTKTNRSGQVTSPREVGSSGHPWKQAVYYFQHFGTEKGFHNFGTDKGTARGKVLLWTLLTTYVRVPDITSFNLILSICSHLWR